MIAAGTLAAGVVAGAILGGLALASGASSTSFPALAGPPGTPPARADAAIGYDPDTKQVVMFGGQGDNGSLADTWIWTGSAWREEHSSDGPAGRGDASMVFDPKLHALVLFGGWSTSSTGDLGATWLWTGHAWERRTTAIVPAASDAQTSLAQDHLGYDAVTGRVVLVGTAGALEYQACSAETWAFDGTNWQLEHPATQLPAAVATVVDESQTGHVLAVLASRSAVANVRGDQSCPVGSPESRALPTSSTWRWTGSTWVEVSAGTEPNVAFVGTLQNGVLASLQAVAGTSMLASGIDEAFWSWTGTRWTEVPGADGTPPPTWLNMQSTDGNGVLLFGGSDLPNGPNTSDTWLWDGRRWRMEVTAGPPTATPSVAPATQNPDVTTPAAISPAAS
jgi:hypothetical protein